MDAPGDQYQWSINLCMPFLQLVKILHFYVEKRHMFVQLCFFFVDARIVNSDFVKHTVAHTQWHTHTQIGLCKMPIYFLMIGTHGPDSFYLIHNQPYYVGIIC